MKLLKVDTLEEARKKLHSAVQWSLLDTEEITIQSSIDRVLAEDIYSPCMVPEFPRSTVDGYAVIAKDTMGASDSLPVFLDIVEEIEIGYPSTHVLKSGQCAYVPTGGMVPEGADAMVMVEYSELFDEIKVAIYSTVSSGSNIISIGEDRKEGQLMLKKGTLVRAQEVGTLASVGIETVKVYKMPTLTIISTGDELVGLKDQAKLGQIHDINTYAIESMATKQGFKVKQTYVLKDEEELLQKAVSQAMEDSDIVVVSGGSSQGKKDITAKVLNELSQPGVFTHGIALKPGKPTILGVDDKSKTILIGLPGHPAAALIVFQLIVVWLKETFEERPKNIQVLAKMETNVASAPGRLTCQLVKLIQSNGAYIARPILGKSGLMSTLTESDGYIFIDQNHEGLNVGEMVYVHLL